MRLIRFVLALAVIVAATVGSEMVAGRHALRKVRQEALAGAAQRLDHIPKTIGDWHVQSESEFAPSVLRMLECTGYVSRKYVHQRTGRAVEVIVLVGPAGPLLVHRPEVCFSGQGYRVVEGPKSVEIGATGQTPHEVFRTLFSVEQVAQRRMMVYYGWSRGGRWEAPEWPRLMLGRQPMLYKLQVSTNLDTSQPVDEVDPAKGFLSDFLPALNLRSEPASRLTARPQGQAHAPQR